MFFLTSKNLRFGSEEHKFITSVTNYTKLRSGCLYRSYVKYDIKIALDESQLYVMIPKQYFYSI